MPRKTKTVKPKRTVYDHNYHKAQTMLRDPWFIKKVAWLKKRFSETGCPLPLQPFKKYQEYLKWNTQFWGRLSEIEKSPEFLAEKNRITGGKKIISQTEYDALEQLRDDLLPPIYGEIFDEILIHFDIDPEDKGFRDFLERHIFFRSREYPTTMLQTVFRRNEKTDEWELFVRIFGHTRKEDIVDRWPFIVEDQKRLKDRSGKSKEWKTFERDMDVYDAYKKLRGQEIKRRKGLQATDQQIFVELHKKYEKISLALIRSIVSRTKKRLGEI